MKKKMEICIKRAGGLIRWVVLAGGVGLAAGLLVGLFGRCVAEATAFRASNPWMLYFLPAAGLAIVALYRLDSYKAGTDCLLEGIQTKAVIPLRMAPLVLISTVLTHAFGGSAGRAGAVLQIGGSLGNAFGKWLKLDGYDHKIMLMCGMSAGFSALFGVPLTATVFSMEVASVGVMQYAALVPCAVAALAAKSIAGFVGARAESFSISVTAVLDWKNFLLVVVLAVLCALVSILFCTVIQGTGRLFKKYIPNEWLRILAGAVLIILMAKLLDTVDYLGAGMGVIELAVAGKVAAAAFILKIIFTAVTLGSGFRGGEIAPALFVGATFGCLFGQITGFPASLAAACGMAAVFCGVTNCPIASLFLCVEFFGADHMPFFLLAAGISYLESGNYGLYRSQKILYSKTKLQDIVECLSRKTS